MNHGKNREKGDGEGSFPKRKANWFGITVSVENNWKRVESIFLILLKSVESVN